MAREATAANAGEIRCVVCRSGTRPEVMWWTSRCPVCSTWTSRLQPAINERTPEVINHDARIAGLRELRRENFRVVVDRIEAKGLLQGKRVLDIGCSDGWFLQEAAERGAETLGLEPDEAIAAQAQTLGLQVRVGRFPEALDPSERFDVITFNDVLEHLPDVREALRACFAHLTPGGILSVNIPTSDGPGYRIATMLARLGIAGPYVRLWQAGLPSPHMHYFPRAALRRLLVESGFVPDGQERLTALNSSGLWHRVHVLREPTPRSIGVYATLRVLAPIVNSLPISDITHLLATRP